MANEPQRYVFFNLGSMCNLTSLFFMLCICCLYVVFFVVVGTLLQSYLSSGCK